MNKFFIRQKGTVTKMFSPSYFLLKRIGWEKYRLCQIALIDLDTQVITYKYCAREMPDAPQYLTVKFFEDFAFTGFEGKTFVKEHQLFDLVS